MKDNPKLKPCPFCGGTEKPDVEIMNVKNVLWYTCWCANEGCIMSETGDFRSEKELVEAWNKRS